MIKSVEIDDEKQVVITRDTFEQMKVMASEQIDLRTRVQAQARAIAEYKVFYELISWCVFCLTDVFGLNVPGKREIQPDILSGAVSPTRSIMKQMTKLGGEAALAEYDKVKKERMEKRFYFFGFLKPLSEFYLQQKNYRVEIPQEYYNSGLPEEVKETLKLSDPNHTTTPTA